MLTAALLFLGLLPQSAEAGTTVSLLTSFAGTINYVVTGGTLRTSPNTGNPCAVGATSSGVLSGIPAGATVTAAYLYWAGSGSTTDYSVTFNGNTVNAAAGRQYTDTFNAGGGNLLSFFSGAADVTSIVNTAGGNATYTFGGLTVTTADQGTNTYCSSSAVLAGWSLVVIYNKSTENTRVINVFEGFQAFRNSNITLTPNNFKIPASSIDGKFSVITWEGDPDLNTGEDLEFNANVLTDACNGANNQYNSTINTLLCTGTAATDDIYYGVDLDTFNISSYLASGNTSATTFYQAGGDLVYLSAQVVSVSNTPVADLGISKSHNGTFGYGDNGSYTISVTNSGPSDTSGSTTTVSDTLPTGETYVSATGIGWTCGAVGQVVTCTSTATVASGGSFNPITLTVAVATSAGTSLANTATVSNNTYFDNVSGNNSSTDTVSNAGGTLVHPDLSTSTKTVFNPGGGDYSVGGTVQYTITLNESAGVDASGVSVTDDIPANLSGFTAGSVTVSGSSTTITNSSTGAGTGTNNDGFLNITNITVPANGSVTIVFTAQVAAGTANCTTINNSGTVTYAGGSPTTATVTAPTIIVAQSSCTATGNKLLYAYDNKSLTRVAQTAGSTGLTVNGNNINADFTLTPVLQKNLTLTAGTITVQLVLRRTGATGGGQTNRTITVSLRTGSGTLLTNTASQTFNSTTATLYTFTLTLAANTTVTAGDTVVLRVNNNSANTTNRSIRFDQWTSAANFSRVSFATSTVINVDSVTAYNAVYPATTQTTVYSPGTQVFICAVISDPFGSADVTSANITLMDANAVTQVSAAAMTAKGATDCAGTANAADEAYEYTYTIPAPGTAATGNWTATVTGNEGTEGTVTHTANGSFEVNVPSLLVTKSVSVSSDPVEGATRAKAIPGATVLYTIQVQNNGRGSVDSNTFVISDPVPTNTVMSLPASPPFTFTDGATSSGLSVGVSDTSITYSNNGGSSFSYTPSCTRPCTDSNITNFKITLTGKMNGKTGASAPSFTISFNVVIQ